MRLNLNVERDEVHGWEWTLPAAATSAPVTSTPPAEEDVPATEAPIGFTGAPIGDPQPLVGKAIDHCMTGPMYQSGTTMFTDGTTEWTEQCAAGG